MLNDVSIASCCSGLPRIPAVYRTPRPIASTYTTFFSTLLEATRRLGLATMTADTQSTVLRARIGVEYPAELDLADLENRIVEAIRTAVVQAGGRLDVLQLDLAARPDWDYFGPIDRVTGKALWDRYPNDTQG